MKGCDGEKSRCQLLRSEGGQGRVIYNSGLSLWGTDRWHGKGFSGVWSGTVASWLVLWHTVRVGGWPVNFEVIGYLMLCSSQAPVILPPDQGVVMEKQSNYFKSWNRKGISMFQVHNGEEKQTLYLNLWKIICQCVCDKTSYDLKM
jgi:hypothetical protein